MSDPSNTTPQDSPPDSAKPANVTIRLDEKTYVVLMHLGVFTLFGLGPLCFLPAMIMWLLKKDTSKAIDLHGKAALNFQISIAIYLIVSGALVILLIGYLCILAVLLLAIIGGVLGAVKASNGELYRYPLSLRLVV